MKALKAITVGATVLVASIVAGTAIAYAGLWVLITALQLREVLR